MTNPTSKPTGAIHIDPGDLPHAERGACEPETLEETPDGLQTARQASEGGVTIGVGPSRWRRIARAPQAKREPT